MHIVKDGVILTFLNILIFIKRNNRIVLAKSTEGINKMCAEVRVNILRGELCVALSVHRPVSVVAYHLSVFYVVSRRLPFMSQFCG